MGNVFHLVIKQLQFLVDDVFSGNNVRDFVLVFLILHLNIGDFSLISSFSSFRALICFRISLEEAALAGMGVSFAIPEISRSAAVAKAHSRMENFSFFIAKFLSEDTFWQSHYSESIPFHP